MKQEMWFPHDNVPDYDDGTWEYEEVEKNKFVDVMMDDIEHIIDDIVKEVMFRCMLSMLRCLSSMF